MKAVMYTLLTAALLIACDSKMKNKLVEDTATNKIELSKAALIADLKEKGYQIFDYVDEATGDTIIMQQYFMAFLKSGPNRNQTKAVADSLQALHMAHLVRMYEEGFADISGPFSDDGDLRGITIYNVPTLKMADSLANLDPMVKAGRLQIEIKPWWAGKGYGMR